MCSFILAQTCPQLHHTATLTIRLLSESVTRGSVGVCKLSLIDFSLTLLFVALCYTDSNQLQ